MDEPCENYPERQNKVVAPEDIGNLIVNYPMTFE